MKMDSSSSSRLLQSLRLPLLKQLLLRLVLLLLLLLLLMLQLLLCASREQLSAHAVGRSQRTSCVLVFQ
jgi:hypothetical protein